MRAGLVYSLLYAPAIVFLDEPTLGLDAEVAAQVRDFVKTYSETSGATILLTSHYMDDVAHICDSVIVIDEGSVVFHGTLNELRSMALPYREVRLAVLSGAEIPTGLLEGLGEVLHSDEEGITLRVSRDRSFDVLQQLSTWSGVRDVTISEPSLDSVMRTLYASSGERP